MGDSPLSSAGLDERRRRALFRSRRRGLREMDLLLGRFADVHLAALSETELSEFERLMDEPDVVVLSWLTGTAPVAPGQDTGLYRRLAAFHNHAGPLEL